MPKSNKTNTTSKTKVQKTSSSQRSKLLKNDKQKGAECVENIKNVAAATKDEMPTTSKHVISDINQCYCNSADEDMKYKFSNPTKSTYCTIDDLNSSESYWTENSNVARSENETISCIEDGGGDAGYRFSYENEYSEQQQQLQSQQELQQQQHQQHCQEQNCDIPQSSTFSQEWLDLTVRNLASPFEVSVPSFNFIQPEIDLTNFDRQFNDPHYKLVEDRAMFALKMALNKSSFGGGNCM